MAGGLDLHGFTDASEIQVRTALQDEALAFPGKQVLRNEEGQHPGQGFAGLLRQSPAEVIQGGA